MCCRFRLGFFCVIVLAIGVVPARAEESVQSGGKADVAFGENPFEPNPRAEQRASVAATDGTAKKKADAPVAKKKPDGATDKAKASAKKTDDSADKKADEAAKATPAIVTVKKAPLKITVELEGVFEGQTAHEIAVKPDEWNTLTVVSAVPHGAKVHKGDVLLKLETDKLDRALHDVRAELKISQLSLRQTELQLKTLEKTTSLDQDAIRRAARNAAEDEKTFFEVDRPFSLKAIDFSLKVAKDALEYEQEELRQLEKMYKGDDISEETEKIVLKRARDTVERAKFQVQAIQIMHDQALTFALPRRDEEVKDGAQRSVLQWERVKAELALAVQRQRLDLERLKVQHVQVEEKLKRMTSDRALMTMRSPIDGVVYYGKLTRGKPADSTTLADSLCKRGTIQANQVVMTIIEQRPMLIRATAPEADLSKVQPGVKGTATPTGFPDMNLPVEVDEVSDIPLSPSSFDVRLAVAVGSKAKLLAPGMTCKVKLIAYLNAGAICVPAKAIITDELDDQRHTVQIVLKDGKTREQAVTLGRKTDKQVEIVDGLSEGDRVVTEPEKRE